jgi:hypothetical protein
VSNLSDVFWASLSLIIKMWSVAEMQLLRYRLIGPSSLGDESRLVGEKVRATSCSVPRIRQVLDEDEPLHDKLLHCQ